MDGYLNIKEASEFIKVKSATLAEYARTGVVKAFKPTRDWLFKKEDLIAFVEGKK